MRSIKFRAWDRDTKTIQIVTMDDFCNGRYFIPHWKVRVDFDQFTGLHDKNGREIYEGDVLDHNGEKVEVCYEPGEFITKNQWGQTRGMNRIASDLLNECSVIGNIHQNPDLVSK